MALAGNCMTKADTCPNCGKAMGFFAGLRGLGMRQKGHVDRCMKRSKAVSKSALTVDAETVPPQSLPAESGETPWHLKPSVGTWNLKLSTIGVHVEDSVTDGQTCQMQSASDACEPESAATEEPSSDRTVQYNGDVPSPIAIPEEFSSSETIEGAFAYHEARQASDVSEPVPSVAASEAAEHALAEPPCFEKAMEDAKQTQVAPESSVSAAAGISPSELAEESLACRMALHASQTCEPEPTTVASQAAETVHRVQPCSETTGDDSNVEREGSTITKSEPIDSSCSFARRSDGSPLPQSFGNRTASQKGNNRKQMYRKGSQNSQQLKWHVKVQN